MEGTRRIVLQQPTPTGESGSFRCLPREGKVVNTPRDPVVWAVREPGSRPSECRGFCRRWRPWGGVEDVPTPSARESVCKVVPDETWQVVDERRGDPRNRIRGGSRDQWSSREMAQGGMRSRTRARRVVP